MTRIARSHPRFRSLLQRARLARAAREGLVVPEGLIAQGRAEAFDYLLGEQTTPSARRAIHHAALWLAAAEHPVVSVNGNVAALGALEVARLARALPALRVEVNLFHRTPRRARQVAEALRRAGVREVLGVVPDARIRNLASDRSRVDVRGIYRADVCLVPLEDGDRTRALRAEGKRVISVDLNPLSRTSRDASLPIIDELTRTLRGLIGELPRARREARAGQFPPFDAEGARAEAVQTISRRLARAARGQQRRSWPREREPRASSPRRGGTGRLRRRTP